jgi:uncharacterized membrane protein (Fun14 family)
MDEKKKSRPYRLGLTLGCMIVLFIILAILGVSWLATCGVIYLITLCFGLTFTWAKATGMWLIFCIVSAIFSGSLRK